MAKKRAKSAEQEIPAESEDESGGVAVLVVEMDEAVELQTDEDAAAEVEADHMREHEKRHYDTICDLNNRCVEAGFLYEECKIEAAHAKKRYEKLQSQLNSLIKQGANPQKHLQFPEEPSEQKPADAWKDVPITDALEMTEKQFDKFDAIGVRTMGQFEHLRSGQMDGFPDGLFSVKGIGQKAVDDLENQALEWIGANIREVETEEGESPEDAENLSDMQG